MFATKLLIFLLKQYIKLTYFNLINIIYKKVGGNHNENLKKDIWSMSSRVRSWDTTSIIPSNNRLAIFNRSHSNISRNIMVALLKMPKKEVHMTIVVKKVPKCLRGIVKLLFGIKG